MRTNRPATALLLAVALSAADAEGAGLSVFRAQMWDQDQPQVPGSAEAFDQLGKATSAGDFDGDGFDDLAIGVPYESIFTDAGEVDAAGAVLVLHGTANGLGPSDATLWHQDTPGVFGVVEAYERFGASLAAGNFNGDAYDDLVIGVPDELVDGIGYVGGVHVLYGSAAGLSATGDQFWRQGDSGIPSNPIGGENFGDSVAAADFDGDGYDDVAIGVPGDRNCPGVFGDCGAVHLLFGSVVGLTADDNQYFLASDLSGSYEEGCFFGGSLAAGDFNADGFADLAVGAPSDDFVGVRAVGSVRVLFGSALGLATDGDPYFLGPEEFGGQGSALAAGDLDGDGDDDLAIGIPGRTVGGDSGAGAVAIRLGEDGLFLDGGEWSQDTAGVLGSAEVNDGFGAALALGDFDADGYADLVVGVRSEDLDEPDDGVVQILNGSASGLTAAGDELWYRELLPPTDPSLSNEEDFFGAALAVGDFDGTGHADLAIGAPGEALTTEGFAGAVFVLHGSLFADGFESGDTTAW